MLFGFADVFLEDVFEDGFWIFFGAGLTVGGHRARFSKYSFGVLSNEW
jgi:hypothetical protein